MRTLAAVAIALATTSSVAAPTVRATGIFSNLGNHPTEGDAVGVEIFVVYASGPHYAVLQCGAGRFGTPIVLPAIVSESDISFTIPKENNADCPFGEVTGKISGRGLRSKLVEGGVTNRGWPMFLPRKKSHWQ